MKTPLILLLLLSISVTAAQGEDIGLSLDEALSLAEKHDLSLATARLDVETGDATVREAISAALPNISLNNTVMRHMVVPTLLFGGERIQITLPNEITTSASFQQPLWLAGKIGLALKAARIYRQIARDALVSSRAKLKSDVVREYFGLVLTLDVVSVTREAHEQARRHAETVERMFKVGMASEFDLLRAQVEVKTLEPEIARAEKNAELARISLLNRLGLNPEDKLVLTEELAPDFKAVSPLGFSDAMIAAGQSRSEFNIFELQENINEINVRAESRNLYWPNFTFGLSYQRTAQEVKLKNIPTADWLETFTWTVNMGIPLFDGFATPAKVQKAKIGLRRTKFEQIQFEQMIRLEVSNALNELKRARNQVSSLKSSFELAERALDIAQTRYEEGMATELEILDVQLALHNTRLGYLQGLYDLRVANAEYARVVENDADFGEGDQ